MPTLRKLYSYAGCGMAAVQGSTYRPAHKAKRDAAQALRKNLSRRGKGGSDFRGSPIGDRRGRSKKHAA